ncbi:hypothetical protein J6590_104856, partial [Homalodisca vitripennis]
LKTTVEVAGGILTEMRGSISIAEGSLAGQPPIPVQDGPVPGALGSEPGIDAFSKHESHESWGVSRPQLTMSSKRHVLGRANVNRAISPRGDLLVFTARFPQENTSTNTLPDTMPNFVCCPQDWL